MNIKLIAAFGLGVVAGAIPSVCVCRKHFEDKLNRELLGDMGEKKARKKPILGVTEASVEDKTLDTEEETVHISGDENADTDEVSEMDEETLMSGSIANEEIAEEREEHDDCPYLVAEDEFYEATESGDDPHIVYLSYWIPNGFFTDEETEKVENPESILGDAVVEECRTTNDEEIFVRVPSRDLYYEIYRDPRDFNATYSPEDDKDESGFYEGVGE
jgi:hypothetical protein